jgi:hypothetical protein
LQRCTYQVFRGVVEVEILILAEAARPTELSSEELLTARLFPVATDVV